MVGYDSLKIIGALLMLISGGIFYWRQLKDKTDDELKKKDEELAKEIIKVNTELKELVNTNASKNQKELMEGIASVLNGQSSIALQVEKALMKVEEHGKEISKITDKLGKVSDLVHELDKDAVRNYEWKKRVEDKLQMKKHEGM